ncbi:5-azacytidine-induced protein 2 isoform X1 [Strix uralensis]|uniref:5-azacytidine-induced protein 2 isoform X1 n=1 Tax=Strix uralensis TaxID=36305 RepID=UPI003DA20970
MEELVEDDICILNHEKADNLHKRDGEIPVSSYNGDESVASHFALVTAYEDIKKRLKETEKENSFLKKRVRILEEKLLGSRLEEECSSVGREQVNKAYQAYREACIDRDNLKSKLDKMMKESEESLKTLNEQLQSKEVELLQLKTEVETQQVMKNLNCSQSSWEIEKLSSDLKVHSLERDLEKLKQECNSLRKELEKSKQKDQAQDENPLNGGLVQRQDIQRRETNCTSYTGLCLFVYLHDFPQEGRVVLHNDRLFSIIPCCLLGCRRDGKRNQSLKENSTAISFHMFSGVMIIILYTNYTFTFHLDWTASLLTLFLVVSAGASCGFCWSLKKGVISSVQQAYWELKREMSNLHLVTDVQTEVLRKLKTNPTATKKAASTAPVQCVDSNISKLNLTSGVVYKKLSQNDKVFSNVVSPPLLRDVKIPPERVTLQAWTDERPIPVDGKTFQEHHSYGKSSLEDNSWVFPSPPKPNENVFWEMRNKTLLNCPADYLDQCNQNCLHKS